MLRTLLGVVMAGSLAGYDAHSHFDSEGHIDSMAAKIAATLELTAAQKPAFDALVTEAKAQAATRHAAAQKAHADVRAALQDKPINVDLLRTLLKAQAHARANEADIDAFIDHAATFFTQLTPDQQQRFAEVLGHRFGKSD